MQPPPINLLEKAENICSTSQIVSDQIVLIQVFHEAEQLFSLLFHLVQIVPTRRLRYFSGKLHAYTRT